MIKIPRSNWHTALAKAIQMAAREETIEVHTEDMKELAELARNRMGRSDVKIVIAVPVERGPHES